MALAMSWLTFVGVKGPLGDSARQPGVTLDTDDADAAEQRDDASDGVATGRGAVEIGRRSVQAPSPAPVAAPEGNYPSTASGGEEKPYQDDTQAPSATATVAPTPDAPKPAAQEAESSPAAKPKASTEKATPKAAPNSTDSAPEPSAPKTNTYVVQQEPEPESATVEQDEHSTWDDLGGFLDFFNPFFAYLPPGLLPEVPDLPFEPFSEVGQTPQPEKFEKLPSLELPEPVQTEPQPEVFAG
ncbi:hypothetical protein ACFUAC_28465 [Streptomyces sp. NPDC057148]|uniref:hypothetical protein n=1 Tax=unclassified Streptomyces TaxID=2593676 RepID=UPI0036357355